jgi:hypothetical protein
VTPEEAVVARLESLTPVTALVGDRIYLHMLPEGAAYPAVRVQLVAEDSEYHIRGQVAMKSARVQVDHYTHETSGVDAYAALATLAAAIDGDGNGTAATGLSGWKGSIGSPAFDVSGCFRVMRMGPRYDEDELQVLTMTQDYRLFFKA